MASALAQNISESVGVCHELIAFDNREVCHSMCEVYNHCAKSAKYDYLCFLHEDVRFNTPNWGERIVKKLSEPDCGVIGFVGSIIKQSQPSGWYYSRNTRRHRMVQHRVGRPPKNITINPCGEDFAQVITLDGLCLFVRKDVWAEHPFDEDMLKGFHGYDIDFSLNVAQKYKNYVTCTIEAEHFSSGYLDKQWVEAVMLIHKKWQNKLPMYTPEWQEYAERYDTTQAKYQSARYMMKNLYDLENPNRIALKFFKEHWFNSRYGWAMLVKIVSDKFKKKRN